MSDLNSFASVYKKLSDTDLVNIINNPNDYQPLAIEAAETEIKSRQLSVEQITHINEGIALKNQQQDALKQSLKQKKQYFVNKILPKNKTGRYINLITICGGVIAIALFIHDSDYVYLIFHPGNLSLSTEILLAWPFVLLPCGVILFGLRKKIGWLALNFSATFCTLQAVYFFKEEINAKLHGYGTNTTFQKAAFFTIIALFFAAIVITMCRKDIRAVFKVTNKTMLTSVLSATLFMLLLVYGVIK